MANYTNLMYDPEAYRERLGRSTDPLLYKLDANYAVNCKRCFAPYGRVGGQQGSDVVGQQIDVDSILRGVSKINSKSNRQQIPQSLAGYQSFSWNNCSEEMEPEYTRYTYPAHDVR